MAKRRSNKKARARGGCESTRSEHPRSRDSEKQAPDRQSAEPLQGNPHKRIAVIGGGAAGLAAAISAARESAIAGAAAQVVVFDADERIGRSILATGNGRCNFSNASIDAGQYYNSGFVSKALDALATSCEALSLSELDEGGDRVRQQPRNMQPCANTSSEDPVLRFFADLGMLWREEGEGRLYPVTGKASTVVDVLRFAARSLGALEACERRVVRIETPREGGGLFHLRFSDGSIEHAASVIVAVGGKHAFGLDEALPASQRVRGRSLSPASGSEVAGGSQTLLPPAYAVKAFRPVLGPLSVSEQAPRQLDNIRVRALVELHEGCPSGTKKAEQAGEVLFRSYGVSGICIFNLSRFAEPGDTLLINFMPSMDEAACARFIEQRHRRLAASASVFPRVATVTNEALLRGVLLPVVAHVVLEHAGLGEKEPFEKGAAAKLAAALTRFPLTVTGVGDTRQCQVMRGGLAVGQFDPATMESRFDAGLFAAGEALDVDAPCGGYNLHWAWASGLLAGRAAACRLQGGRCDRRQTGGKQTGGRCGGRQTGCQQAGGKVADGMAANPDERAGGTVANLDEHARGKVASSEKHAGGECKPSPLL